MTISVAPKHSRAYPFKWGAQILPSGETQFRLWAPGETHMTLVLNGQDVAMTQVSDGWFETTHDGVLHGTPYQYRLESGLSVPDPASRAQHADVHGPSLVIDPKAYRWINGSWTGRPWEEAVIYELHIGTFTQEGTFKAAIARLPHLAELGITAIEIMPVAQFPGARGWGYDGVLPYAPHSAYGSPDDMKALIDAAHGLGLMVLLDVVYNHFGPDGNYLSAYAPGFFAEGRTTPWGAAMAYEKPPVRQFFVENALYWLEEYNLDGLRFDAIDQIGDETSPVHILVEIAERIRFGYPDRHIHLTTEDNRNVTHLHTRDERGLPVRYTGEWNDDFHNVIHVIATGETEGYYADFAVDHWAKLGRALSEGFVFQGEQDSHGKARGEPSRHLPAVAFVDFIQNHDQVGNRAFGERLISLSSKPVLQVLTGMLLLSPHIPLLFMGEEYGETNPFCFFADYTGDLADAVREGRRHEFAHFAAFADEGSVARIPDPNSPTTFDASKLDWTRRDSADGAEWMDSMRTLLALRQKHIVPLLPHAGAGRVLVADEGVVAVEWPLVGAVLRMCANFTDQEKTTPSLKGEVLYAQPSDQTSRQPAEGRLPAHSLIVRLERKG